MSALGVSLKSSAAAEPAAEFEYRIGIDIGGTFTDIVIVDRSGKVKALKSLSTPADPSAGVIDAIMLTARQLDLSPRDLLGKCGLFVHGSTIATNTLLERKGAKVAMITTDGFRDTLEIRRGLRVNPWDHRKPFPPPLVPRRLRLGVTERMLSSGDVLQELDVESVRHAIGVAREGGANALAVALLNSYRNPSHEEKCRALIEQEWPGVWISCSSELAPVIGEYERGATAVADAYVGLKVVPYLRELEGRLKELGYDLPLLVVQSNGGVLNVEEIARQPVRMALSGPAAGVGALQFYGADTGSSNLVAIEVGGTSCDVTMMIDNVVAMTDQLDVDGHCISTPSVEIHTVGAGGGTIGHVDTAGLMHAGPQGAGARPGPACYGKGGTKPTVTDAQLVLGRLAPGAYAGGAMVLDLQKARDAIEADLARPLGISIEQAAAGFIRLVEQTVLHAVERVSLERGYDPHRFTLVAAGGAGPLHGASVAKALGCAAVYVPRLAGVFCAFGMCNADVRVDRIRSWSARLASDPGAPFADAFSALDRAAAEALNRQGFAADQIALKRSVSLRYVGQQWPLEIDCDAAFDVAAVRERFEQAYEFAFGHYVKDAEIEISHLRVAGIGQLSKIKAPSLVYSDTRPVPKGKRPVWIDEAVGVLPAAVYDGTTLRPGHEIDGPAVVDEETTTVFVSHDQKLRVTGSGNFMIVSKESVR